MKQSIILLLTLSLGVLANAQENSQKKKTEVIIISNGEIIDPKDVEITINKDGKKQKIDADDVKIINKSSNIITMNFDEEMMDNMRLKMQKMLSGMGDFGFNLEELNFGNGSISEFNKEFEELDGKSLDKKIEKKEIFLGNGNNQMLFKSDDGGVIKLDSSDEGLNIQNSDVEKEININNTKEGNKSVQDIQLKGSHLQLPSDIYKKMNMENLVIVLNDEVYKGDIQKLKDQEYTYIRFSNKDSLIVKYGDKAANGVIILKN